MIKRLSPFIVALALIAIFLIPPVFIATVNSLVAAMNWTSSKVGYDWHRIPPGFKEARDLAKRDVTVDSLQLVAVFSTVGLALLGLAVKRTRWFFVRMVGTILLFGFLGASVYWGTTALYERPKYEPTK
jgi:hypothetical protein